MRSDRLNEEASKLKAHGTPGLLVEEPPIHYLNEEYNQYANYFLDLIRAKSIGNVLIVDDDPLCSMFIEKVIREFSPKLRCLTAVSEAKALAILARVKCDLVLADYFLEGPETGLDLCRKIKTEYPEITCVMMSGMKFEKYQDLAVRWELQPDFMEKPISSSVIQKYLAEFYEVAKERPTRKSRGSA